MSWYKNYQCHIANLDPCEKEQKLIPPSLLLGSLYTSHYLGIMKLYLLFIALCLVVAARASPQSDASQPRSLRNPEVFGEETITGGGTCSCRQQRGACVPSGTKTCTSGSCHCSAPIPAMPCKGSCK